MPINIYAELARIQQSLKVPKVNRNNFGKYNYRTCSDILEQVKPHLGGCSILLSDEVVPVGDRIYVKASAMLAHPESEKTVMTTAYAREPLTKKGMDESQITGASSSYARKIALSGLLAIDDTDDADVVNQGSTEPKKNVISEGQRKRMFALTKESGLSTDEGKAILSKFGFSSSRDVTPDKYDAVIAAIQKGEVNG